MLSDLPGKSSFAPMEDYGGKMKVVGRRSEPKPVPRNIENLQRLLVDTHRGRPYLPRGVFRFKSHDEADEWLLQMLTR